MYDLVKPIWYKMELVSHTNLLSTNRVANKNLAEDDRDNKLHLFSGKVEEGK